MPSQISERSSEAFLWPMLSFAEWSSERDLLVADVEEEQENDASDAYIRRMRTSIVLVMPKKGDSFKFPIVDAKLAGRGSEIRTSDRVRQEIEEAEEHCSESGLQGNIDEPDSGEQRREQDELKTRCQQESSIPTLLKSFDVARRTHTHYIGHIERISD